jgi:hypothetical protein
MGIYAKTDKHGNEAIGEKVKSIVNEKESQSFPFSIAKDYVRSKYRLHELITTNMLLNN